MLVFYFACNHV